MFTVLLLCSEGVAKAISPYFESHIIPAIRGALKGKMAFTFLNVRVISSFVSSDAGFVEIICLGGPRIPGGMLFLEHELGSSWRTLANVIPSADVGDIFSRDIAVSYIERTWIFA